MEPILHEFGSLLLRWAHITAGMAWKIGRAHV